MHRQGARERPNAHPLGGHRSTGRGGLRDTCVTATLHTVRGEGLPVCSARIGLRSLAQPRSQTAPRVEFCFDKIQKQSKQSSVLSGSHTCVRKLSEQREKQRSEVWVVTAGEAVRPDSSTRTAAHRQ